MSSSSLIPSSGNDGIQTPDRLACRIVEYFAPQISKAAKILEPCAGQGAFLRALSSMGYVNVKACEILEDSDFFKFDEKVDWVITNPPWSKTRDFLRHSYEISKNVVFLITLNHVLCLRARLRDMRESSFNVKELFAVDTPPLPWPQSGFQLGVVHIQKDYEPPKQYNITRVEFRNASTLEIFMENRLLLR
jgi:hypothetical protein